MTKKIITTITCIILACIILTGSFASLATQIENNDQLVKARVYNIISDYFQYRESNVLQAQKLNNKVNTSSLEMSSNYDILSTDITLLEESRINGIKDFLDRLNLILIDCTTDFCILDYEVESDLIHITAYESLSMVWMFESGKKPFESAMGIDHDIYVDPVSMTIQSDEYYEKDFSGISTTKRNDIYSIAEEPVIENATLIDLSMTVETAPTNRAVSYSPANAVSYALSYTVPISGSSANTNGYNRQYKNYAGYGGDCANFISQCLYAGGYPMTTSGTYVWYYDDNGTSCTNSSHTSNAQGDWSSHSCTYDDSASASWAGTTSQRTALVNLYGASLYGPNTYTNTSVYLGNLLYTQNGGHVYICTDASNEIRCYTCHTTDKRNWPFDITTTSAYILRP